VHQVGYLQEMNQDARSTKHKIPYTIRFFYLLIGITLYFT